MQTFFAVVAINQFEDLKRQVGYRRAMALLDTLRDDIVALFPECQRPRANRSSVEFTARCQSRDGIAALFAAMRDGLAGNIPMRGRFLPRAVTIAAVPCRAVPSEAVVVEAEKSLRAALRDRVPVFVAEKPAVEIDDHQLIDELHAAITGGSLTVHYQPKLRAAGGDLGSAEALVRWVHPSRGAISPDIFIPLAERSGDIGALTSYVIDRVQTDQVRFSAAGLNIRIDINVSAPLIADPRFIDGALQQLGSSCAIGFEITETAMIADPEGALSNLHRLSAAGIHLAIDDYGSGFSSLAYLQRLPVDELKIDQAFVTRLTSGPRDPLIVRSTIDLAHALEMEVTAEGVETASALALLQVMRCDFVQGYFLSPALTLTELIDFAHRSAQISSTPAPTGLRARLQAHRNIVGSAAA